MTCEDEGRVSSVGSQIGAYSSILAIPVVTLGGDWLLTTPFGPLEACLPRSRKLLTTCALLPRRQPTYGSREHAVHDHLPSQLSQHQPPLRLLSLASDPGLFPVPTQLIIAYLGPRRPTDSDAGGATVWCGLCTKTPSTCTRTRTRRSRWPKLLLSYRTSIVCVQFQNKPFRNLKDTPDPIHATAPINKRATPLQASRQASKKARRGAGTESAAMHRTMLGSEHHVP